MCFRKFLVFARNEKRFRLIPKSYLAPRVGVSALGKVASGKFLANEREQLVAVRHRQVKPEGSSSYEIKNRPLMRSTWRLEVVPFFIHFSTYRALSKV